MPCYSIAGVNVRMNPMYSLTADRATAYRIEDDSADIEIGGMFTDAYEEYAELAKQFYAALLAYDGFLLHSSAVALDNKAYVFSAPSGTGKSTHAAYWRSLFGATALNDDKPAIRLVNGVFYACGTPFSGKCDLSMPQMVPLESIVVLRRGDSTKLKRLHGVEVLWRLLDQILRPTSASDMDHLLTLVEKLVTNVPVYEMECTNDPQSAYIAKNTLCL